MEAANRPSCSRNTINCRSCYEDYVFFQEKSAQCQMIIDDAEEAKRQRNVAKYLYLWKLKSLRSHRKPVMKDQETSVDADEGLEWLRKKVEEQEDQLTSYDRTLKEQQLHINQQADAKMKLSEALEAKNVEIERLEGLLEKSESSKIEIKCELDMLKSEMPMLEKELRRLQELDRVMDDMEKELEDSESSKEAIQKELDALKLRVVEMEKDKRRIGEYDQAIAYMDAQIKESEKAKEELETQVAQLKTQMVDWQGKLQASEESKNQIVIEMNQKLEEADVKYDNLYNYYSKANYEKDQAEYEMRELKKQLEAQLAEGGTILANSKIEAENSSLKMKMEKLVKDFEDLKVVTDSCKRLLEGACKEKNDAEKELKSVKEQLNAQLKESETTISQLQAQLSEAKQNEMKAFYDLREHLEQKAVKRRRKSEKYYKKFKKYRTDSGAEMEVASDSSGSVYSTN